MTSDWTLRVASGTGRLVRRESVLLFTARAESEVVTAFDHAETDDDAVNAVKQHLVDRSFAVEPLVVARWSSANVDLLVFGPVEVHSSTAAVPMITGAGSASWVECRLGSFELGSAADAQFWCGAGAEIGTDLRAGIAAADGFHLSMPAAVAQTQVAAPQVAQPQVAEPQVADPVASVFDEVPVDTVDEEDTDVSPDEAALAAAAPLGLVEAVLCGHGHPNRPGAASCSACSTVVAADAPVSLIAQPVVGSIVFTTGQTLALDRSVVLGRKPIAPDAQTAVMTIDEPEVSREHAVLEVDGWTAHLTDSGSRNGTFVIAPDTVMPVQLEDSMHYVLEHGTTVHLGGPEVAFRFLVEGMPS